MILRIAVRGPDETPVRAPKALVLIKFFMVRECCPTHKTDICHRLVRLSDKEVMYNSLLLKHLMTVFLLQKS